MAMLSKEEQFELVERVRKGDQQACAILYTMMDPQLRRGFYRLVPESDMDDFVQETMARAFEKIDQFIGDEAAFSTWCTTVARNTALMAYRSRVREAQVIAGSMDDTYQSASGQVYTIAEPSYDDRTMEQKAAFELIQESLAKLKVNERTALRMQLDGYSIQEIAEAMDKSVPSVKSYLVRGRTSLAAILNAPISTRRCKCGCGTMIPARGWAYAKGHGKQARRKVTEPVAIPA